MDLAGTEIKISPIECDKKNITMANEPSWDILIHQELVDWIELDIKYIINGKIKYIFNLVLFDNMLSPLSVRGIVVTANSSLLTKIINPVIITKIQEYSPVDEFVVCNGNESGE